MSFTILTINVGIHQTAFSGAVMSSNGETNVVLRGVTHGAVDFLIKPVRIEELRNVWQHVVRRKRDQVRKHQSFAESFVCIISFYNHTNHEWLLAKLSWCCE